MAFRAIKKNRLSSELGKKLNLKGYCHEMTNIFQSPKNQISTFCMGADGFHNIHRVLTVGHGLINYIDTKAKCRHLKKLPVKRDFAAGVYQSLFTGDRVRYVGIFDPSLNILNVILKIVSKAGYDRFSR